MKRTDQPCVSKLAIETVTLFFKLAVAAALLGAALLPTAASQTWTVGEGGDFVSIQAAIDAAEPGDTIEVAAGTYELEEGGVTINKAVTLQGQGRDNTTIEISSDWFDNPNTKQGFDLYGDDIIIKDIHFKVVGKGQGSIIRFFDSNIEIKRNKFSGEYVFGDSEVTRATEWGATAGSGIVFQDNIVESLRQPGWINNGSGTISGNFVNNTRGWLLADTYTGELAFTHNIFGANSSHVTVLGGADLSGVTVAHNDLGGTVLDWAIDNRADERLNATCNYWGDPEPDFAVLVSGDVDTSTWYTDEEMTMLASTLPVINATQKTAYATIQAAIDAAESGDTIQVAAGTYAEDLQMGVPLTLAGIAAGEELPIIQGTMSTDHSAYEGEVLTLIENIVFAAAGDYDSVILRGVDGLTFRNCTFDATNFSEETKNRAVQMSSPFSRNITFDDCLFTGGYYLAINGYAHNLTVKDSTIENCNSGINLQQGSNLAIIDTDILLDTLRAADNSYCVRFGFSSGDYSDPTNLTIMGGTFSVGKEGMTPDEGKFHSAIIIRASASGTLVVSGASIQGEVVNQSDTGLEASANWWGGAEPDFEQLVSGDVLVTTWYEDEAMTQLATDLPVVNITQAMAYSTIQAAINAAESGDTIEVAAGTYQEDPVMEVPLHLVGIADNGALPILAGKLTVDHSGYQGDLSTLIENIKFRSDGDYDSIVLVETDGLTIKNCDFLSENFGISAKNRAIYAFYPEQKNTTIEGCSFSGYYIVVGHYFDNLTVIDSTIENCNSGINVGQGSNLVVIDTDILLETLSPEENSYGVRFGHTGSTTDENLTIMGGVITVGIEGVEPAEGKGHRAIWIRSSAHGDLTVQGVSIDGEVVNYAAQELIATGNWWGDASGPEHATTNPGGTGSAISDNVAYDAWYADEAMTVMASHKPVINVTRYSSHDTIQEAIDAAEAGDTIEVAAGTYAETLTVDQTVTLKGSGSGLTIVEPAIGGVAVTIDDGTELTLTLQDIQLKVTGSGRGINCNGRTEETSIVLEDSIIDYSQWGRGINIFESPTTSVTLTGSIVDATDADGALSGSRGLQIWDSSESSVTITDSTVAAGHYALLLAYSENVEVNISNGSALTAYGAMFITLGAGGHTINVEDSVLTGRSFWSGYFYNPSSGEGADSFAAVAIREDNVTMNVVNSIITNEWIGEATSYEALLLIGHPSVDVTGIKVYLDSATQLLNTNTKYVPLDVVRGAKRMNGGLEGGSIGDSGWYINGVEQHLPAMQYTYYVHPDGDDANDGLTPARATRSMQPCVDDASDGDSILVSAGTHVEKIIWVVDETGSIQDAIGCAWEGETILVKAGTYAETIDLNKAGITVRSTDGAEATIIDVPAGTLTTGVRIFKDLGDVTLDGFTIQNFTSSGIVQSWTQRDGTAAHVWNNRVIPAGDYLRNGIQVAGYGSTVIGNYVLGAGLTADWSSCGIHVVDNSNVTVADNTIVGHPEYGLNVGIAVNSEPPCEHIVITGNTIQNVEQAFQMAGYAGGLVNEVAIHHNRISAFAVGVAKNEIQGEGTVTFSNISATHNWWGTEEGPPAGSIMDGVPFSPWYADMALTQLVYADDGEMLADETIEVGETVSVPGTFTVGDRVNPVTLTVHGTLHVGTLDLQEGAVLQVINGTLILAAADGGTHMISGTFTVFDSFGSIHFDGDASFTGGTLFLISNIHVEDGKVLTVSGSLTLDGCVIDSEGRFTIDVLEGATFRMARSVVVNADISIASNNTEIRDNLFDAVAIQVAGAVDGAKIFHNIMEYGALSTLTIDSPAQVVTEVDGWENVAALADTRNDLTLDFDDSALLPGRTYDAGTGMLFLQPGDLARIRLDVGKLLDHKIQAVEAMMGYSTNLFEPLDPENDPPELGVELQEPWEVDLYEQVKLSESMGTYGLIDTMVGLNLSTEDREGTSADGTVAKITLQTRSNEEGVTVFFFRLRQADDHPLLDTRLAVNETGDPADAFFLTPFTLNTSLVTVDGTDPLVANLTAEQEQGGATVDVFLPGAVVQQGTVLVAVDAFDALAGIDDDDVTLEIALASDPDIVLDATLAAKDTVLIEGEEGTRYTFSVPVTASTVNGVYIATLQVADRSGNTVVMPAETLTVDKNQVAVTVALQGAVAGPFLRNVVFTATDEAGNVLETWSDLLEFVGREASLNLTLVPDATAYLSAKADLSLRRRLPVGPDAGGLDALGQAVVAFTAADHLLGGDVMGDNVVATLDFATLRANWLLPNTVADLTGSGDTATADFDILRGNWLKIGHPE